MRLFQLALAPPTTAAPDPSHEEAVRQGMSMLMMVSVLGVVIVTLLAIWVALRSVRRKQTRKENPPTDMSVDPWVEAGKRIDDSITEFDEEL